LPLPLRRWLLLQVLLPLALLLDGQRQRQLWRLRLLSMQQQRWLRRLRLLQHVWLLRSLHVWLELVRLVQAVRGGEINGLCGRGRRHAGAR